MDEKYGRLVECVFRGDVKMTLFESEWVARTPSARFNLAIAPWYT